MGLGNVTVTMGGEVITERLVLTSTVTGQLIALSYISCGGHFAGRY